MRIAHLMLFNFYLDNAYYQENILPIQNKADGHDVIIIASTQVYSKGNTITFVEPATYYSKENIKITRVPYKFKISNRINVKLRAYKNVYEKLFEFKPDIIFIHGISGYELKTTTKYKRNNPHVKLYIDCHADYYNSASNFISREILHSFFYRSFFLRYVKYIEKVYYIAPESLTYLKELYKFDDKKKLEYLPLGGYIISKEDRVCIRNKIRDELNISKDDVVFTHAGKLDEKKKSLDLIQAFAKLKQQNVKLKIIGDGPEYKNIKTDIIKLDMSNQISLLGYKSRHEIAKLMAKSDSFVLSSRSETFGVVYIEALMAGLPVIATACGGPEDYVTKENGLLVPINNIDELSKALREMYSTCRKYDREKISKQCQNMFSPETIALKLTHLYYQTKLKK